MTREIKFRGKRIDGGEWVTGHFTIDSNDRHCIWTKENAFAVFPETVSQFTGLKSVGGVEVYEGDLLRFPAEDTWANENFTAYEVFFHDNDSCDSHIGWQINRCHFQGAICGTDNFPKMIPKTISKMYKIGNIYENPELLK